MTITTQKRRPVLTLIRGLPGSGKSTLAAALEDSSDVNWYEADHFFSVNGEYNFDASLLKQAHQWCQKKTEEALSCCVDTVVSNTFTQKWEMQPYLDMAKKYNAIINVIVCKGEFGSVHNVPEETIERMRKRWEE